jgi:hypothetical protein
MNRDISSQDWQRLSDYLDKQLSEKEALRLEAELNQRPDLKEAYDDLKVTHTMLHALPYRRAPHNFTLSTQQVSSKARRITLFPVFSFVSLASTLALILVLIFQPAVSGAAPVMMALKDNQTAEQQVEVGTAVEPTEPAQIIYWGNPPRAAMSSGGYGGGGEAAPSVNMAPLSAMQVTPAGTEPPQPKAFAPAPPPVAATETTADRAMTTSESLPLEGSGPILGVRPTANQGLETSHSPTSAALLPAQQSPIETTYPYLQLILGGIAIISGITALITWKKQKS